MKINYNSNYRMKIDCKSIYYKYHHYPTSKSIISKVISKNVYNILYDDFLSKFDHKNTYKYKNWYTNKDFMVESKHNKINSCSIVRSLIK